MYEPAHIYLMQTLTAKTKLGCARNPLDRAKVLTWKTKDLHWVTYQTEDTSSYAYAIEKRLHRLLFRQSLDNEYYSMKHDFAVNLIEDFWRTRPEELTELDLLEQWCRRYPRKE